MVAQVDGAYAAYGVGRLTRRLVSYSLFEGRPATTRGQWFNPVVFRWLDLLGSLPGQPRVESPVFITGLGRSGTTILGVLLSLHPQVGFLNEPKAIWHRIDPRQDLNANYTAGGGTYRLGAADVTEAARRRAHRIYSRYLAMTGARRVVDKYPELIFRVDYVRAIFPDARFIFITRRGTDAVPSVVQWSRRLGVRGRGGRVEDWWGRQDAKWRYLREQLILSDPGYGEIHGVATADLDHANRAALEWIVTMREGLRQERRLPEAVLRIAYEDLLADPAAELARLQQWCGLPPDPAVADYARRRLYDNPAKGWPSLHPAVDRLFRDTMEALGYADDRR
jgi:LPS sulfotransferase NodH